MRTVTASASGRGVATAELGNQVARKVMEALGGPAQLVFCFAGIDHATPALLQAVRKVTGPVPLVGCSTAGEFSGDEAGKKGLALLAVASPSFRLHTASASGLRADHAGCAKRLASELGHNLDAPFGTVLLLADGLAGDGETTVRALHQAMGARFTLAGGAAGDEAAFKKTWVFQDDRVLTDALVGVKIESDAPVGVGVRHGLLPRSEPMEVTRAEGSVVYEIDHRPAFAVYEDFARARGDKLDRDNASAYLITHELGVPTLGDELQVRAPLTLGADGSLSCATEIREGSRVRIMGAEPTDLLESAKKAAAQALERMNGARPAGAVVFDCICRGLWLGDRFLEEAQAIARVVDGRPIAGFETYGEIAKAPGLLSGFHNTTAVVAVLPE
jgi:methyl-accepting chemotaxis protein